MSELQHTLVLKNIYKSFGEETPVLQGIDLTVPQGEFLTLLGPSGCGKTTTLRIIAGLESPDSGEVWLDGVHVTEKAPNKRSVNTVFQSYALFPHMSVGDNVGYGLKLQKVPKAEIKKRVSEMLDLVQLSGYEKRRPNQLSGGQKQRVAIARALINNPRILLLDEPLGALDLQLRRAMQMELKHLQKKLGITFIYITHDQEEAINMSDRIAVMRDGRFEQIGTSDEIYNHPKTSYVATFVGNANILKGQVKTVSERQAIIEVSGGEILISSEEPLKVGEKVTLAVRSENLEIRTLPANFENLRDRNTNDHPDKNADRKADEYRDKHTDKVLLALVKEKSFAGGQLRIRMELPDGTPLVATRYGIDADVAEGETVGVSFAPERAVLVDRSTSIAQGLGQADSEVPQKSDCTQTDETRNFSNEVKHE